MSHDWGMFNKRVAEELRRKGYSAGPGRSVFEEPHLVDCEVDGRPVKGEVLPPLEYVKWR